MSDTEPMPEDSADPEDPIIAVDLFAGAGGLSTGLALACEALDRAVELVAVNHWGPAVETHERNHSWATQLQANVEDIHPPDAVPGDDPHVDMLIAAPECTHWSRARGGKPVSEQKRASPWHVLDWVEKLDVENILFENIKEFQSWGPIEDGQPTRNGEIFDVWINALHALGYSVDWDVLNAADYGDATSRERLFVIGRQDRRAAFPEPTHAADPGPDDDREPWRPAAAIIDWSDLGNSIWTRSRPLSNNTMQRIAEGLRRHCPDHLASFADVVADLTPEDVAAMQDDVVAVADLEQAAAERDDPFLVQGPAVGPVAAEPANSTTTMIMGQHGGAQAKDATGSPVPTIATRGAIHCIHADPFVLPRNGPYRGLHSNATYEPAERPLHTVTAKNHDGHLVWPFLVPYKSERAGQRPRTYAITAPYPTVTATGSDPYLARPFLVEYNGNSDAQSIDGPLPTVTTTDRHALYVPNLHPWGLDLRYRMLQPHELAAAQGFPDEYDFAGTKTETTKQIGNAVPVNLASALCQKLLTGQEPSLLTYTPTDGRDTSDPFQERTTD